MNIFIGLDISGSESSESTESDESAESRETTHRHLIGADNKCTFGPSYWCSTEETMKECNVSLI